MGKKLVTMLVSVGFFAVLITVLNLMALQAIRGKNNVLIEQFEQYEEAVKNNDTAVFETAKGEVAEAIRHSNYRINGSIIFDLALVVADIIVIVLLSIVINKSIVRPAKRAKNDLDDIILGIESGQGNLTLRVFDETSDEIGQLANGVNHFIETLQNLMVKIQSVSKDMKKSSYLVQNEAESSNMSASNVSATSEELAASMEEVSASLYDLVLKDDEAVVLMVDSNLQREMISPSEKAFAYKMKYEAIKRKVGRRKCGQVDHNLGKKSIELIGEECGDSPKQVQLHRFFPVTYTAEQMRREILEMLKLNMKKYWDA